MMKKVDGIWIPENPEDEPKIIAALEESRREAEEREKQEPSIDDLLAALAALGVSV